jgi:hypothetical protein
MGGHGRTASQFAGEAGTLRWVIRGLPSGCMQPLILQKRDNRADEIWQAERVLENL